MIAESYWQLLGDPAHWLFEATTGLVFDVAIGVVVVKVVWPRIRDHFHRDVRHAAGHAATDDPAHVSGAPTLLRPGAWDWPRVVPPDDGGGAASMLWPQPELDPDKTYGDPDLGEPGPHRRV